MLSAVVVPVEPFSQVFGKLSAGLVGSQVDPFILQGTPEPFDEDVVLETTFAIHADFHVPALLKISGAPYLSNASLSGEIANLAMDQLQGVTSKVHISLFKIFYKFFSWFVIIGGGRSSFYNNVE